MSPARHVLVVDDTDAHRYVMASWLRRAGYEVSEAATGVDALAAAGSHLDAIVLDVNLPDMSGLDVGRRVKEATATAAVPVLHVSATAIDARARSSGLALGADAYLAEPLDRDEFLAVIGALCRSHEARRDVDEQAQRLTRLATALVPMSAATSLDQIMRAAAVGTAGVLERPVIVVARAHDGAVARCVCAGPGQPVVYSRLVSPFVFPQATAPGQFRPDEVPGAWRDMLDRAGVPVGGWHYVPLRDPAGRLVGAVAARLDDDQDALTPEEEAVTVRLADALTVTLANMHSFREEHELALTLQRSMLPATLPTLPGVDVAARYSASDAQMSVGGDFYDAFELGDGTLAVVIGDVQGHSLRAATVMVELRISLRAYLLEGHPPARALDLLNDLLIRNHPEFVTVCVAVLDAAAGRVVVTNAGHLPPLLVTADGASYMEGSSPLLGLPNRGERLSSTVELSADHTLVLVTDGLLERRAGDIRTALSNMSDAVAGARTLQPELLCDLLLERFDISGREDDVAILVVRSAPDPDARRADRPATDPVAG
ncbi:SpoIIE family protein phosphatase [Cellulomonas sp.]|uniref:SpoIIE family protein phosphatase n=1 Tax=Cellulomonas sp. TaxID=40001 RepID=UPI001B043C86|nr:SpoIIE family protein phosphatase [Cellulomonas sp.]MBO9553499.1 SpoIIE family protein phosphatase [Cellulomonas sp.]